MSTHSTLDTPRTPTSSTKAKRPRTRQFSRWQTLLGRLGLPVVVPAALLIGAGLGAGAVILIQRSHSVVATVNGVPIRQQEFYHRLELAAGPQVLQQLVNEQMQLQFAEKQGVLPMDTDVQAKLDHAKKQATFAPTLAKSRQTEDDVRHSILVSLAQYDVMTKGVTVTDADVQAFYRNNSNPGNPSARYYSPEATQVGVIVTPSQQSQNQVIADIAAGMSFANAAAKYSIDASKANGGLLKPMVRGRSAFSKVPKLEDLIFQMRPGQQRIGVRVGSNWWIIRCVGYSAPSTKSFADVADDARLGAMLTKGEQVNGSAVRDAFAQFQRSAIVKPVWPQYQTTSGSAQ